MVQVRGKAYSTISHSQLSIPEDSMLYSAMTGYQETLDPSRRYRDESDYLAWALDKKRGMG